MHGDRVISNQLNPGSTGRTDDTDLVRRMAEDDPDAFAALFERHRASVYRAALALTGDPGASEEVLVDTFQRAYLHRRRLRTDASPLPWLHKVALNLCRTRLGRRRLPSEPVTDILAERLPDVAAGPAARVEAAELQRIVREGIAALPDRHREVVVLYYLDGLSLQETADVMGIPLGTVKSRLHHALRDLRGRLSEDHRFTGAWVPLPVPDPEAAGR